MVAVMRILDAAKAAPETSTSEATHATGTMRGPICNVCRNDFGIMCVACDRQYRCGGMAQKGCGRWVRKGDIRYDDLLLCPVCRGEVAGELAPMRTVPADRKPEATDNRAERAAVAAAVSETSLVLERKHGEALLDAAKRVVEERDKALGELRVFRGHDASGAYDLGLAYVLLDWMKGGDRTHGALGRAVFAYLRRNREGIIKLLSETTEAKT